MALIIGEIEKYFLVFRMCILAYSFFMKFTPFLLKKVVILVYVRFDLISSSRKKDKEEKMSSGESRDSNLRPEWQPSVLATTPCQINMILHLCLQRNIS